MDNYLVLFLNILVVFVAIIICLILLRLAINIFFKRKIKNSGVQEHTNHPPTVI